MSYFEAIMHKISISSGEPQTPLGELTAIPQTLAAFKGSYF